MSDRFGDSTITKIIKHRNNLNLFRFNKSFKKHTKISLGQFEEAWQKAQTEIGKLAKEIRKTDAPSKTLQSNFRKAKNTASLAKTEFLATKDATRQMGTALRNAGIDTKNLSSAQSKLGKNLASLQ